MPCSQDHLSSPRSSRGVRRRTLRIAAAGLTAVAALTLTACGGQDNPLQTSAAKPFNPAPGTAEHPAAEAGEEPAANGDGSAQGGTRPDGGTAEQVSAGRGATGAGAGTGGAGRSDRADDVRHPACDAAAVRIVAKPLKEPVNHLLLVATNTSGATCDLYFAPNLRFGQAQSPLPELPDSKPHGLVALAPGESGYAGVLTSSADGSGRGGRTVTGLSVGLPGRDGKGSIGGAAQVALPGGSVYVDDSAWVTYWQANPREATAW
ncbi:DUF4232 domain-containing protein [Streptomyces sp. NPDC059008]|uniref:DUF4232 domain-containing protein n=1 Tax=Streptomyces sp. NPDC059008 TaxID=3346693 RepID=UPI0036840D0D